MSFQQKYDDLVAQNVSKQKVISEYIVQIDILDKKNLLLKEDNDIMKKKILILEEELNVADNKKKNKPSAYHNFVHTKLLELKNSGKTSGRTVRENMFLVCKEWKELDNSEKIKYNSSKLESESEESEDKEVEEEEKSDNDGEISR